MVGLPGDEVAIKDGFVYIDDKKLIEPYLEKGIKTEIGTFVKQKNILIPANEYFILGDNRSHSNDSRYYGFVNKEEIIGKFFYVYQPSDRTGTVKKIVPYFE